MKQNKGRILHLEDDRSWIEIVEEVLGNEYDIVVTDMRLSAAGEFYDHKERYGDEPFDLAIVDIRIKKEDQYGNQLDDEKGGVDFISDLIRSEALRGNRIIVLSANPYIDESAHKDGRFEVLDRFDKGDFDEERFKQLIDEASKQRCK